MTAPCAAAAGPAAAGPMTGERKPKTPAKVSEAEAVMLFSIDVRIEACLPRPRRRRRRLAPRARRRGGRLLAFAGDGERRQRQLLLGPVGDDVHAHLDELRHDGLRQGLQDLVEILRAFDHAQSARTRARRTWSRSSCSSARPSGGRTAACIFGCPSHIWRRASQSCGASCWRCCSFIPSSCDSFSISARSAAYSASSAACVAASLWAPLRTSQFCQFVVELFLLGQGDAFGGDFAIDRHHAGMCGVLLRDSGRTHGLGDFRESAGRACAEGGETLRGAVDGLRHLVDAGRQALQGGGDARDGIEKVGGVGARRRSKRRNRP